MNTFSQPILANFTSAQVSKPVAQRITLEVSAHALAMGYCSTHDIRGKEGIQQAIREVKDKFNRYAVSPDQIKRRQLVFFPRLRDIRFVDGKLVLAEPAGDRKHLRLYPSDLNDTKGADLKERHDSYGKVVGDCLSEMYDGIASAPDDMIHVTCSGYLAPSPVERMVANKEWFDTTVTHSYHMGCYGAFPAIRMAHGFLSSSFFGVTPPKQRVDIVHTELLSLHNNIESSNIENIVTMTLFADGFIKYSVCSDAYVREHGLSGLRILAVHEHLLPESADDMTWTPAAHQLQMTLSVKVPLVIKQCVHRFVVSLLRRANIDFERDKHALAFAIHPGGPKIVEHIQDELGLDNDSVVISKNVFHENGNMSSATIPHILKEFVEEKAVRPGTRIVCLGFGPGLTVTGMVLEKI
ncbi:3-oxoacyl-[acyl-carrier-protein] synthase III C-terminal domain-containing protein [Paraburkholderia sp. J67]|uniref:3-oxoacyl-[acyl-carrier-protein] synthase III C-terminal domain-containing protein n=1 Tax=Paraburkholderia sp. J67 TaxID=2805435 RepID=UPI002ABDF76C|nr:3-oxoacyl-[acyl-carrier-protein] synthase III C-terminal domain-containing protein [Paraburkholderia sp. J67]